MALPEFSIRSETLEIDGERFTVRGLYRGEALGLQELASEDRPQSEIEPIVLAAGLDEPLEAIADWYRELPSHVVDPLVTAILRLSGMGVADGRPTASPSLGE